MPGPRWRGSASSSNRCGSGPACPALRPGQPGSGREGVLVGTGSHPVELTRIQPVGQENDGRRRLGARTWQHWKAWSSNERIRRQAAAAADRAASPAAKAAGGQGGPRAGVRRNAQGRERNRGPQRGFTENAPSQRTRRADPARSGGLRGAARRGRRGRLRQPGAAGPDPAPRPGQARRRFRHRTQLRRPPRPGHLRRHPGPLRGPAAGPAGPGRPRRAPDRRPSAAGHAGPGARRPRRDSGPGPRRDRCRPVRH